MLDKLDIGLILFAVLLGISFFILLILSVDDAPDTVIEQSGVTTPMQKERTLIENYTAYRIITQRR